MTTLRHNRAGVRRESGSLWCLGCLLLAVHLTAVLVIGLPLAAATQESEQVVTGAISGQPTVQAAEDARTATSEPQQADVQAAPSPVITTQLEGRGAVNEDAVRFEAIDVFVDSAAAQLAAYQFEMKSAAEGVEIVGIEGGEHPAFAEPPYYDPRAMHGNRVVLAAFHTGDQLPTGRNRVARVHVQLRGPQNDTWQLQLVASADATGRRIPAAASIARAARQ